MVKARHVYHLAGFDPIDAGALHRRFARQLELFQHTWKVEATLSELHRSDDRSRAWWTVNARAANWDVKAVHEIMLWDDIVRNDFARPLVVRLFKAVLAYFDFVTTGTMSRYSAASKRYAVFFHFPFALLALFAICAAFFGWLLMYLSDFAGIAAIAAGSLAGWVVFVILLQWPGRRWRVLQLLDDWSFARAYLHNLRPDLDARLDRFAETLIARARDPLDEIVIVGHSLGAMLAIDVISRTLGRDPDFGRRVSICLLTVGATIPKFALYAKADRIRHMIARVTAEPLIAWAEFQAREDSISFYKFDPVSLRPIGYDRLDGKPLIRCVHVRDQLQPETFIRYRHNALRVHYQSVMANEKRAPYDYYLMVCGPVPFICWTVSGAGFLDFITTDGAYEDAGGIPRAGA